MGNPSSEALMISALIKTQDVHAAEKYGVHDKHFRGFSNEYQWLLSYVANYGTQPSEDAFFGQFPDFPYRDHTDVRFAADEMLRDYAQHRFSEMVIEASQLSNAGDVRAAFETLQKYHYTPTSAIPRSLISTLDFFDEFDSPARGIQVPWPTLQEATAGIGPGQFWLLAARLNQGKSAALCVAAAMAVMAGKRVVYYSMEMTEMELRGRIHVIIAQMLGEDWLKALDIKHRNVDIRRYRDFVKSLPGRVPGELHIHTPRDGIVSPATIASRAEQYDLAVVDYVGLMYTDSGEPASTGWNAVMQISNRIKQVCLATDTPVIAAAQINREGDHGDNPPKVGNLAAGDSLGQDADVVVTMRSKPGGVAAVASLEKNRHGPAGMKWWMRFSVNDGIFDEIHEERADALVLEAEEKAHSPKLSIVRS
jgi:hypothetical protein